MFALRSIAVLPALVLAFGCSQAPRSAAREAPPEPVSGQSAFHKMFVSARSWAQDAQPLRVADIGVADVDTGKGLAAAWEAVFISPSQGKYRRYIYSVVHRPARNLRGGVNAEPEETWAPGGSAPFLVQALKTDSTAAYETALQHAGGYAAQHAETPVRFVLEKTHRFPSPVWRVYWGESVSTSGFSVFVDATTGEYAGTGR